jgi:hypothetical protein
MTLNPCTVQNLLYDVSTEGGKVSTQGGGGEGGGQERFGKR